MGKIIKSLRLLTTVLLTYSPIGVIAVSAPRVKNPMPTTTKRTPNKKDKNKPLPIGVNVTESNNTISAIGRTEEYASLIFSLRIVLST